MKKVKKVNYIHDLGGITTSNLHHLKHGLLFRSGNLSKIDDEGLRTLVDNYHIDNVIDLRTDDEVNQQPEEFISKAVNYLHMPLLTNEENPAVNRLNRLDILSDLIKLPGGVKTHMKGLYRTLVSSPKAIKVYQQLFKMLLNNKDKKSFLFHCTQGKDRTGVLIFLLLKVLGVSTERAKKTYLSFNRRSFFKRVAIFLGMNIAVSPRKAVALNRCLTAKRVYINSAIEEIDVKFGGIENYIKNYLLVSDEDMQTLRTMYVK